MKYLYKVQDIFTRLHLAYLRRKVLSQKLNALTDPTFLDRAIEGERRDVDPQGLVGL